MNKTINELMNRTSLRKFSNQPISEEHLSLILQATKQAPSAGNMQMYSIIKITNPAMKKTLSETCDHQPFIAEASHILIFCNDYSKWDRIFKLAGAKKASDKTIDEAEFTLSMQDALIAAQNAVVAAESLGIGSCYIGDIMEHYEKHKELLKLPDYVFPCCMLVLGYYPEGYHAAPRKRYDDKYIVFDETYKTLSDDEIKEMFSVGTPEETVDWINRFYNRKINSEFFVEMGRSIHDAIEGWKK